MSNLDVSMRLKLINQLSGPAKDAKEDLEQLRRQTDRLGASQDKNAARFERYRAVAVAGGAAIAAGVLAAGKAAHYASGEAMTFETAMAEVRKAVDVTDGQFADLERSVLQVSEQTGVAKENLAGLVAEAARSGRPLEELTEFALLAAKGSVAFGMSAEETSAAMSKMGNALELSLPQLYDLGDAINHLADNSASNERDLINFINRTGSTAKIAGLAAEETAAFGAALLAIGVPAEVAGTGFNAFINKISTAEKQGKKFAQGLDALGLSAKELKAALSDDAPEAMLDLLKRIDKLPDADKLGVLTDMFGLEYADDIAKLAGSVDLVGNALELVSDKAARAGSLDKSFAIFDATTQKKIDDTGVALENLAARVGANFTPAIGAAADAMSSFLTRISETLDRASEAEAMISKFNGGGDLTAQDQARLAADPELAQGAQSARRQSRLAAEQELAQIMKARQMRREGVSTRAARRMYDQYLTPDVDARIAQLERTIGELSSIDAERQSSEDLGATLESLRTQLSQVPGTLRRGRSEYANPAYEEIKAQIAEAEKELAAERRSGEKGTGALNMGYLKPFEGGPRFPDQEMDSYKDKLTSEGQAALAISEDYAARMQRAWSFTATPTIKPQLVEPGRSKGGGRAGASNINYINQNISGAGNPERVAAAANRRQDRAIRQARAGALYDTGAYA
jgi:TP901 family phage tail tape measure protein